jgi:hypothetical protein
MMESGKTDMLSERADSFILMEISMMANGQLIKLMDLGLTSM